MSLASQSSKFKISTVLFKSNLVSKLFLLVSVYNFALIFKLNYKALINIFRSFLTSSILFLCEVILEFEPCRNEVDR